MIIEEGLSRNGRFYPAKVLEQAKNLFEKSKVCFYEWKGKHFNHLPATIEKMRPEGFPAQTAGYFDNVKFESVNVEGKEVKGLTGFLHIFDHEKVKWLKEMLSQAWNKGLKQLLGLSINADGAQAIQMVDGRPLAIVQSINKVFSTDIVSDPAAGGRLLKMVESFNESERRGIEMFKELVELFKKSRPDLLEGIDAENMTEADAIKVFGKILAEAEASKKTAQEAKDAAAKLAKEKEDKAKDAKEAEVATAVAEATKALSEADVKENELNEAVKNEKVIKQIIDLFEAKKFPLALAMVQKVLKAAKKPEKKADTDLNKNKADKALEARLAQLEKDNKISACKNILTTLLASSKLPMAVQEKISKQFTGTVFEESTLVETIRTEKAVLGKLSESGEIIDLGDSAMEINVRRTGRDRLQASMDLTFGYEPEDSEKAEFEGVEGFKSLREMYVAVTGDIEVTGQLSPQKLKEATTSGSFSYMLGYTINRRMLKEYRSLPELWKNIANIVSVKDFKMQELIRWGGFGVLPTVISARTTQGTATDTATPTYPELGFPLDTEQLYAVETKGGLVTVTRRAIINDDLRQLVRIPIKLARAANRTLNQFVFDLMLGYTSSGINSATPWPDKYGTASQTALYAALHNNYQTTALGYDILNTMLTALYNQGEDGYKTETADATINSSTTTINVTAGTGQYFKAGDMIRIGGEYILVNSVSTDALTVTRGILGTTAAAHNQSGANYPEVFKIASILGLQDITLWIPRTLHGQAMQLNNSALHPENAENGVNALKGLLKPMTSPYLRGDENNYFLSAGKQEIDLIEIGFLNGKVAPEILVQDQPTVGNVFVYDTIRYKVRHEYGGVVPDYRAFAASIVSGIS